MADPLDELAVVPPAEFVAARTRIAADLKAAGDTEAAARIAKLRKPNQLHWAINVTVREHPDLAAAWAAAAEHARSASGADLRPALAAVRDAAAALAKAVGRTASAGDAAQILAQAAADPDLAAAVASGTVGFDVADRPAVRASPGTARSKPKPKPKPKPEPDRTAELRARAEQALADARVARDEAHQHLTQAESDLEDAAAELDAARARLQQAERDHLAAQRRRAAAERLLVEADDALTQAEKRLDR